MRINLLQTKFFVGLAGLILLSSCRKNEDVVPNNGQIAYVNFYDAADGMMQNNIISMPRLQIDEAFPGLKPQYQGFDGSFQFPGSITGSQFVPDFFGIPGDVTYKVVYWLPVQPGNFHFMYHSFNYNAKSQDTTELGTIAQLYTQLSSNTFITQYFSENLKSDTSYTILNVPVERKGTPGKVRIQVVNTSPDLGPLEVYREDDKGAKLEEGLPRALASGTFSQYVEVDTTGAYKNLGQLLFKVRKAGGTATLLTASVPATSNSSFTLVVQGFASATVRRLNSMESTGFTQVTVAPNLRVRARRVF